MAMKIQVAQDRGYDYHLEIWLDDTKFDTDGVSPDPEWVRTWNWGKDVRRVDMRRETQLLAQGELNKMNPVGVVALSEQGETL